MTSTDERPAAAATPEPAVLPARAARALGVLAGALVVVTGAVRLVAVPGGAEVALPFVAVGGVLVVAAWAGSWPIVAGMGAVVAVALVVSPAASELAFNLARPEESGWFLWSVALLVSVGLAAAAIVIGRSPTGVRGGAAAAGVAMVVVAATTATAAVVVGGAGAAERAPAQLALPEIQLFDAAFGELRFAEEENGDRWALLVNDTAAPHTFTVAELGVDVYVPAGRDAVLRLPASDSSVSVICTIGDHADEGMVASVDP